MKETESLPKGNTHLPQSNPNPKLNPQIPIILKIQFYLINSIIAKSKNDASISRPLSSPSLFTISFNFRFSISLHHLLQFPILNDDGLLSANSDLSIMLPSTPISAIVAGKIDFQVRVRVINLWIVPDRMKPTEDGTIQMIFLDDKCHKIQATVRKDLIPKLMDQLEEGSAYVFENFMVGSKDAFYKSIGHNKYKLNFMTSTTVFKVTAPEIPRYHFDFVPFPEILNATDESRLVAWLSTAWSSTLLTMLPWR